MFTLFYRMAVFSHAIGQVGVFLKGGRAITFVLVHSFIEGCQIGPDASWIEMKSLFFRDRDFSWAAGLEDFQTQLSVFSLHYHVLFSCINIV